jgi:hypothetical protein
VLLVDITHRLAHAVHRIIPLFFPLAVSAGASVDLGSRGRHFASKIWAMCNSAAAIGRRCNGRILPGGSRGRTLFTWQIHTGGIYSSSWKKRGLAHTSRWAAPRLSRWGVDGGAPFAAGHQAHIEKRVGCAGYQGFFSGCFSAHGAHAVHRRPGAAGLDYARCASNAAAAVPRRCRTRLS